MSAAARRASPPPTGCADDSGVKRRRVSFSLGSDPESELVRAWLHTSADQGDESRRIRQALALALQLGPHLAQMTAQLAALPRIEAQLAQAPRSADAAGSRAVLDRDADDPLTAAEAGALAALLDTD